MEAVALEINTQLGASCGLDVLHCRGYPGILYDFNKLSADPAGIVKRVADSELSVVTILEPAKAFQRHSRVQKDRNKGPESRRSREPYN